MPRRISATSPRRSAANASAEQPRPTARTVPATEPLPENRSVRASYERDPAVRRGAERSRKPGTETSSTVTR